MIISNKDLLQDLIKDLRKNNLKIVFTNGCFDILHKGHVKYLSEAKKFGDILIVGINSDLSIKKIKGSSRPVIPLESRIEVLNSIKPVDFVISFDEETPLNLISLIKPDVHVKGGDYTIESLPESKIILEYGGKIKIINLVDGFSTTNIVSSILKGV
ncbi:D-glycero-beta-D-manno-heptose 1-phosphate adenylyltransferase [Methanococcus maripaludis]|uniref:D-glycero-beta-D-manno-heptose 1-phosphate adenylyltransferase n=1 Tax=Methanococcus maripaludis TaxID=39152 RepID=A0A7J9PKH0_METMI|nr:D-glycero-beta-D-manno-heptose 1-phosphate adenylyltransferase [Methanococcus maripaludis]MBA2863651.1 rfaE bifunctional protein nucleotidyltransferase chain/domain [Methanococcus maripaludis]MBB6496343.1 rfaE bifunctional protein nucleotidyltransferase chain/domain [Methanococcus maripaludis]